MMISPTLLGICLILFGCCVNNFFLELIVKQDPGCAPLLTFIQFFIIAFSGLIQHIEFKQGTIIPSLKPRTTPIHSYALQTLIFFIVSFTNNKAFHFHISQPLHMMFRSSSLVANMFVGYIGFGKRFTFVKMISVFMITIGVFSATSAEANVQRNDLESDQLHLHEWMCGIGLLVFAVVLSALLGNLQEQSNRRYGRNAAEGMFYSHFLALPYFTIFAGGLLEHVKLWSASEPLVFTLPQVVLDVFSLQNGKEIMIPSMWVYIIINVITQYICIRGVYMVTSNSGTLTCTFTITVRKFISLIISLLYFNHKFLPLHWVGTILVFGGVFLYANDWTEGKEKDKKA